MAAYQAQNKKVSSCKCGPDYIDPMFHKEVLGVDSKNLDLFFSSEDELRKEYAKHAADAELAKGRRFPFVLLSAGLYPFKKTAIFRGSF